MQPVAIKPFTIGSILVIAAILIGLLVGIGVLELTPVWFAVCVILLGLGFFV
jgi:hypothetical protein